MDKPLTCQRCGIVINEPPKMSSGDGLCPPCFARIETIPKNKTTSHGSDGCIVLKDLKAYQVLFDEVSMDIPAINVLLNVPKSFPCAAHFQSFQDEYGTEVWLEYVYVDLARRLCRVDAEVNKHNFSLGSW